MVQIGNDWDELLAGEFEKDYYQNLRKFLAEEYRQNTIYPDMHDIFNALKFTPYSQVRAVILGQDPYHGPGQAHGRPLWLTSIRSCGTIWAFSRRATAAWRAGLAKGC